MPTSSLTYRHFVKSSLINASLDRLKGFHEDPKALAKLTPPPIIMQLHRDARRSITDGEIEFTLWFGVFPVRWIAGQEPGPSPLSFADRQIKGPMAYWRHEHIFTEKPDGVELADRIILAHRPGWAGFLTRLFFDGLPLRLLFAYRHRRTRMATQLK